MHSLPPDRLAAALLLAAIAGCVDAVGYGELGGFFVSFMSGNSTLLGIHFAYGDHDLALFAFGLIVLFVGGAALGTLIAQNARRRQAAALLLVEAALLAGATLLLTHGARPTIGAVLLPVAMGLANTIIVNDRGNRIALTYMTGTLVRIGTGLTTMRSRADAHAVFLDVLLWTALVAGVVCGGYGRLHYGGGVLWLPVAALLVLGVTEALFAGRKRRVAVSVPSSGSR